MTKESYFLRVHSYPTTSADDERASPLVGAGAVAVPRFYNPVRRIDDRKIRLVLRTVVGCRVLTQLTPYGRGGITGKAEIDMIRVTN